MTGLAILAAGLVSAFHGLRMVRLLLVLYCAGLGAFAGQMAAGWGDVPPLLPALGGAAGGLVLAMVRPALAGVIASGAVWAGLLGYLGSQFGMRGYPLWIAAGLGGCIGVVFSFLCRQSMMVLLTVIAGSALMIIGFVGAASGVLPSVAGTFRNWGRSVPIMIPMLLGMLSVMSYSLQSREQRGDIRSGSQRAVSGARGR